MVSGFLVMGGLGIAIGVVLALASKIFYVYVDPKIEAVEDALPGANCGGCGLPGCSSNAVAIVAGKASASSCVAGGPDVSAEVAMLMGVKIELKEAEIAAPGCSYGYQDADIKYLYQGINDCRAALLLDGGSKTCPIGCLGLGTCVKACPFGALSMGPDNLPVVDTVLVDLDDFVIDPLFKSLAESSFFGDRTSIPRQFLLDYDLYDHDLVTKLPSSTMMRGGEKATAELSQQFQGVFDMRDLQDMVNVIELWVPGANALVTIPDPREITFDKYIGVTDYK